MSFSVGVMACIVPPSLASANQTPKYCQTAIVTFLRSPLAKISVECVSATGADSLRRLGLLALTLCRGYVPSIHHQSSQSNMLMADGMAYSIPKCKLAKVI